LDEIRPGFVAIGRVLGARGLRGELKIELLAPETALAAGHRVTIAGRDYTIEHSRPSERPVRLKISGVNTREEALLLRGAYLQALERDLKPLPDGEYYRFQLIGLAVRSLEGRDLGRGVELLSTRENDVYVVDGPHGEVLIPAVDDVVRNVDLAAGIITVELIPGLLP